MKPSCILLILTLAGGSLAWAQQYNFTTVAGGATPGYADGTGSAARFNTPLGVAVDSGGNVYVADSENHTIRKVTPTGIVTALPGLAGTDASVDGIERAAHFSYPQGVAVDNVANVYVADGSTILKVTPTGVFTTLAGLADSPGSIDGMGGAARFRSPSGVAVDSIGNVYVADRGDFTIRKITPDGAVTTLAGLTVSPGSTDGTGRGARFANPAGIAVDIIGNLFVADAETIRKVTPAGVVTTLAGLAGAPGSADGTGSGARFQDPQGVAVDSVGYVYVADTGNFVIRKITPDGVVSTVAGLAGYLGSADGTGSAARFFAPFDLAVDSVGNLYVADTGNQTIRTITPVGGVSTLAGLPAHWDGGGRADGTASAAQFQVPSGIAVDSSNIILCGRMGQSHDPQDDAGSGG